MEFGVVIARARSRRSVEVVKTMLCGFAALATLWGVGSVSAEPLPSTVAPRVSPPVSQPTARARSTQTIDVDAAALNAPAGAEQVSVVVTDIAVEGATVFTADQLAHMFEDVRAREVRLSAIFAAAARLQQHYRDAGYPLTRVVVPPQRVSDGVFTVRVIEGFVNKVTIDGDVGPVVDRIAAYLDNITQLQPLHQRDLERYLLLVTDIPGIEAIGVLRPGTGEVGASELIVKVQRTAVEGFALLNNRGSEYVGPGRFAASVQHNAATSQAESLRALVVSTLGNNEQRYGLLAYEQAVGEQGLRLQLSGGIDRTRPGGSLAAFDIEGETRFADVGISYPLIRSRATNLTLRGGLAASSLEQDALATPLARDELRILYAELDAYLEDNWAGRWNLRASLRQGLDAFGASEAGDANLSRQNGRPDGTAVTFQVSRYQPLGDSPWGVFTSAKGQFAWDPLLSNEECTLGGETFGRGYDPSEISGDRCLGLMLEAQYTTAVDSTWLKGHQAYAFYDLGAVWNKDPGGVDQSLASAGVGWRGQFSRNVFLDAELAKPLTRDNGSRGDNDPYLYFQLTKTF